MARWSWADSSAAAEPVAGLFPPQDREWSLPTEAPLTTQAAVRLGREAATQQGFEPAARALNADWGLDQPLHSEQVRRWSEGLGATLVAQREREVRAYQCGQRPACPPNAVPLLVIGMDGGRYQGREKDPESGSRWREEKVLTLSTKGAGRPRSWSRRTWRRRSRSRRLARWREWKPSGAACGRPSR